MGGIFGFVDPERRLNGQAFAAEQARLLSHVDWAQTDWFVDPTHPVAIGRLGIGIFNAGPQPVWDAKRERAIVVAGEAYMLEGQPPSAETSLEAQMLELYTRRGATFARHVDGAFVCAVWDTVARRLVITNDRFAFYPLYYTAQDRRLVFASEVKAVIAAAGFRRKLDVTALAQYGRFQHLIGDRTFFEDVLELAPATAIVFDLAERQIRRQAYWSFLDVPHNPRITPAEAAIETGRLLRRATERFSDTRYATGVYLSGGLDSRTLLGLVATRPVHSFTYGVRGCRDVVLAERIARAVGSTHHWCDLPDGRWVLKYVDRHLALTEGFHSWIHAHGISTVDTARQHIQVNLSGWDGGQVMGHPEVITPQLTRSVNDLAFATHLFELMNQHWTWPGLTEAEERCVYHPELWRRVRGLAFDSLREEIAAFPPVRPEMRSDFFSVRHHCQRFTHNMMAFYRTHVEVRFPFFDYAVFDFLNSLPLSIREDRKLFYAVIARETPALARIPFDKQEFLPTANAWLREPHAAWVKARRRINQVLPGAFPPHPTLYADYEGYLRTELRSWAEGILYDRRTEERGIFEPGFVRTLMARHMSGKELWTIGKIAPLITLEMMFRQMLDTPTPAGA